MVNIDNVLKPYQDNQPDITIGTNSKSKLVQRMPIIVNEHGILPEFQDFYDKICSYISDNNVEGLWTISDKAIEMEKFNELYDLMIGQHITKLLDTPECARGIDIELNIDRFKELHRNMIGGFNIMTYQLSESPYEGVSSVETILDKKYTEILFTFKQGEFLIISHFKPFKHISDE